jgi:large subunit ribosomal protein L6
MSRLGSQPITVPSGASVEIQAGKLLVKGPKGQLTCHVPKGVEFKLEDQVLVAGSRGPQDAAVHGLAQRLAQNAVTGVTQGFKKDLEIVGIGYRAAVAGRVVVFNLGYSHTIEVLMPEGVNIAVEGQNKISISGIDKQVVGEVAAKIRSLRPPDPYKNKGIRYAGEVLRKKEGKTGSK